MGDPILNPIPLKTAEKLCAKIRAEADRNWPRASARWCWHCQVAAGGDPAKRGFRRQPGNRGCILINTRYIERLSEPSE